MDDWRAVIDLEPASTLARGVSRGSPNQSRSRCAAASRGAPPARCAVAWNWLVAAACASVVLVASAPAGHGAAREVSFQTQPDAGEEVVVRELYEAFIKKEVSVTLTIPGTHKDFFGPQDHPYDAQLTLIRRSQGKNPIRIVMAPGTVIKGPGNDVVLLDEITVDISPDHLAEKTISLKAYRMRLPESNYGMDSLYRRPSKRTHYYVYNIHVRTASDPVRQAAVWMRNDVGMTYEKYTEFYNTPVTGPSGGEMKRTDPFRITKGQWAQAERIARVVTTQQKQDMLRVKAEATRKFEESQRLKAEARAEAKAKDKAEAEARAKTQAEARAKARAEAQPEKVVVRELYEAVAAEEVEPIQMDIPNTMISPYDAQVTVRVGRHPPRAPFRILMKAGTFIDASGGYVSIDEVAIEFARGGGAETTVAVKMYSLEVPRRGVVHARNLAGLKEAPSFVGYVCTLPELRNANDQVRQAAIWLAGGHGANEYTSEVLYQRYFRNFKNPDGTAKRPDPYGITKAQWDEALRIVQIVTPERQREKDERRAKENRQNEDINQRQQQAKDEIKLAKFDKADRKARYKRLTLLEALDEGLVTASIDELITPPSKAKLTVVPTPALGDTVLDVIILPGTIVRESLGGPGARTAYLSPARVEVELPNSYSIRIHTHLRTLDDAGPGTFVFELPHPLAASLMYGVFRDAEETRVIMLTLDKRRLDIRYAGGEYVQLMILEHGDKDKPHQQWRQEFAAKGLDDPYASIAAPFKEGGQDLDPAMIQRAIRRTLLPYDFSGNPDRLPYPESHIVGSWHLASSSQAIDALLDAAVNRRVYSSLREQLQRIPNPAELKIAVRGMYQRRKIEILESWRARGTGSVYNTIKRVHDKATYDLVLRPDHTYQLDVGTGITTLRATGSSVSSSGTWFWDGKSVVMMRLKDGIWGGSTGSRSYPWSGPYISSVSIFPKGLLTTHHFASLPAVQSYIKAQGILVKRSGGNATTGSKEPRPPSTTTPDGAEEPPGDADQATTPAPKSKDEKKPKFEPTHVLVLADGKYYYGQLISETDEAIRFRVIMGGLVAELTYQRSEIKSVSKLKSPPGEKPPGS